MQQGADSTLCFTTFPSTFSPPRGRLQGKEGGQKSSQSLRFAVLLICINRNERRREKVKEASGKATEKSLNWKRPVREQDRNRVNAACEADCLEWRCHLWLLFNFKQPTFTLRPTSLKPNQWLPRRSGLRGGSFTETGHSPPGMICPLRPGHLAQAAPPLGGVSQSHGKGWAPEGGPPRGACSTLSRHW